MKNLKQPFILLIFVILIIITTKTYKRYKNIQNKKSDEQTQLKESARILKECFDLDNKNKRSLNRSLELIEYCMDKYGPKND